ncbi:MAG: flavodoxin family protein [Kiritimatiellales bacterium]|nr:flavodoxin family protein [Pontiella sp.]NNJ71347.1 flavodoxin family protein [Kiritimatiellales bacterium]
MGGLKIKLLVINGSYRKGRTIDTLVERAVEGARQNADISVTTIRLTDRNIKYCTNCMVCRNDDPSKEIAKCSIADDMQELHPMMNDTDFYIFATPINCGTVTAVMKTFLERTVWVHARPGRKPLAGCPEPRSAKKKRAIILLSSGIVPALLRRLCDDATSLIKSNCECSYNAKVIGSLYAGAIEKRGMDQYLEKAYVLGTKLTKQMA